MVSKAKQGLRDRLGLTMLMGFTCRIFQAVWTFTRVRKRGDTGLSQLRHRKCKKL